MRQFLAAAALALLATGCTSAGSGTAPSPSAPPSPPGRVSQAAAPDTSAMASQTPASQPGTGLHKVHDPGQVTGTLTGPCRMRGSYPDQLPDPGCTPGAYDPAVTAAVLCSGSYSTRSYRPPVYQTSRFKYETAYPAYGLPADARTELDHLVSLELGGANDAANLWPEPPPTPNPKDSVENALHRWVCAVTGTAAQARLTRAQHAIARNWTTAEKTLGIT